MTASATVLAFKKTNQNTQEVKNERIYIDYTNLVDIKKRSFLTSCVLICRIMFIIIGLLFLWLCDC